MSKIIQPSNEMQISLFIKAQLFHQFCIHSSVRTDNYIAMWKNVYYQDEAVRCIQLYPYNTISQSDLIFIYYFMILILVDLMEFGIFSKWITSDENT